MPLGALNRLSRPGPPPKVSLLVPNCNRAAYLRQALASALAQDFADFELLISDDASSDDSVAVSTEFARRDSRIALTIQPARLGLAANFNWCLGQARGEYVKFLLNDDRLARRDSLRRLVSMLEQAPDIVLASSAARIINAASEGQYVRDYLRRDQVEDGGIACRRCLLSGINQVGEPSLFLFRRRCAGKGFNPAYRLWLDFEFALRVLEQGRFAYCSEPLTDFRKHPEQESQALLKLLGIEHYRLLATYADRPWLGRNAARQRLFEARYQERKQVTVEPAVHNALETALDAVGRGGYPAWVLRRKLLGPFVRLGRWTRRISE